MILLPAPGDAQELSPDTTCESLRSRLNVPTLQFVSFFDLPGQDADDDRILAFALWPAHRPHTSFNRNHNRHLREYRLPFTEQKGNAAILTVEEYEAIYPTIPQIAHIGTETPAASVDESDTGLRVTGILMGGGIIAIGVIGVMNGGAAKTPTIAAQSIPVSIAARTRQAVLAADSGVGDLPVPPPLPRQYAPPMAKTGVLSAVEVPPRPKSGEGEWFAGVKTWCSGFVTGGLVCTALTLLALLKPYLRGKST